MDIARNEQLQPKVLKVGNTTIRIHSRLAHMTSEERREWYRKEWERGNPVLRRIAEVLFE